MFDRRLTVAVLMVGTAAAFGAVVQSLPDGFPPAWWLAGGAAGYAVGLLYWHRFRGLGFVPPALTVSAAVAAWAALGGWSGWAAAVASFPLGFAVVRLGLYVERFHRWWTAPLVVLAFVAWLAGAGLLPPAMDAEPAAVSAWWPAGVAAALAVLAWVRLARPAFELALEPPFWLCYPMRAAGPGLAALPATGPCLVVANHACWLDPGFLGKVLPRPTTPMMTSRFYDLPGLHFLMARILKPIRVFEQARKTGTPPEVAEAVAALDRGQCVVIFPEGYLRRSEDVPLRRFGRGVWQILAARPDTPVFPCWIEGGWGSYTSYFDGKPTKGKKMDLRRRIGVAVDGPVTVSPDTLAHHLTTRIELMNRVAAARKWLGLPELPPYALPKPGEGEEKAED